MFLTRPYERNAEGLASSACWLGARPIVLSTDQLKESLVASRIGVGGEATVIRYGPRRTDRFALDEIDAVWSRGFGVDAPPRAGSAVNLSHHQWKYYAEYVVGKLQDAYWMNPHASIALANNRLLQMELASRCGFLVPESLVTNQVREAAAFVREHGSAVAKQISSGHPRECADRMLFAARINQDDIRRHQANIRSSPTLFQAVVDKTVELRTYVVEGRVFCAGMRIDASDHVDARSLITDKHYFRFILGDDTVAKVRKLVAALNLRYAAVDMAIDSAGNLVFFEANHSGQWGYVEKETGHPITQSIAEELVGHARA